MGRDSVIGSDHDGTILFKSISLDTQTDSAALFCFDVIFEDPGDLVSANEKAAVRNFKSDFFLEEVKGFHTAMFESALLRCSYRVEHSKIADGDFLPVLDPGLFVAGVPEGNVVSGPGEVVETLLD